MILLLSPFLCFMSLDFDLDMDVGYYIGLKRRLIKDFFDSLAKEGVTTDEERIEIVTGAPILAICPPELLTAVNIFDKSENSDHVFKKAREEARKRACSIGVKREETVHDRELRELYLAYFPRLLPKLGIYSEVSSISTASVWSRCRSGSTDRRQRARSPYFNKESDDPRRNRTRSAESISSRAPSIISRKSDKATKRCYECNKNGHFRRDCYIYKDKMGYRCKRCKNLGHGSANCRRGSLSAIKVE